VGLGRDEIWKQLLSDGHDNTDEPLPKKESCGMGFSEGTENPFVRFDEG
jgi:hypothetical protein